VSVAARIGIMCAVPAVTLDARAAALTGLIDHAALFPPASMSMADALAEDQRLRSGEESVLVRRFVVPVSRFAELGPVELPLSVVLDMPYAGGDSRVEAVEAPPGAELEALVGLAAEVYVELPADLDRLAALGLRAKLRCGGASVPSVEEVAEFIRACRDHGLVFKATAGLHQALRRDGGHGFLNLLAACVFGDEERALADGDPAAFALDAESFRWRVRSADGIEVARVRADLWSGFGSCSVSEPFDELRSLGVV
jgi:hypothetical protein